MQEDDSRKIVDKVRDDYNLIAKEWDLSRSQPSRIKIKLIGDVENETEVLDIGCGNGMMVPYVLEKGAFYFGLDISENLIDIARERYAREIESGKAKFVVGEATTCGLPGGIVCAACG